MTQKSLGFTLIELMIALSVFAFLIMIAGPQYAEFMGNMQIRNGAENTLTGVRRAQGEAVRANTLVQFILDPTPCSGGWQVSKLNDETNGYDVVDSYTYADGACKTTPSTAPNGATKITFNGLGRIVDNLDASARIKWVEITNTNVTTPRILRVVVNPVTASGIKLCDPDPIVASNDARFCPAT
ncbi:MAG: GspH/FimT family pseudopilin [Betaproteobacteria bacterium]